jgi:hypothetical protein
MRERERERGREGGLTSLVLINSGGVLSIKIEKKGLIQFSQVISSSVFAPDTKSTHVKTKENHREAND